MKKHHALFVFCLVALCYPLQALAAGQSATRADASRLNALLAESGNAFCGTVALLAVQSVFSNKRRHDNQQTHASLAVSDIGEWMTVALPEKESLGGGGQPVKSRPPLDAWDHDDGQENDTIYIQHEPPGASPENAQEIQKEGNGGAVVMDKSAKINRISSIIIDWSKPNSSSYHAEYTNPMEISIGREIGNTLQIDDDSICLHHAIISCEGNHVFLENKSQQHGNVRYDLYAGKKPVIKRTELSEGCQCKVGRIDMIVHWKFSGDAPQVSPVTDSASRTSASKTSDDYRTSITKLEAMTERIDYSDISDVSEEMTERIAPVTLIVSWSIGQENFSKRIVFMCEASVGRSAQDTVVIDDPKKSVSRHHVVIQRREDGLFVTNGSREDPVSGKNPFIYQNREIVDEVPFVDGMTIQLGYGNVKIECEHR